MNSKNGFFISGEKGTCLSGDSAGEALGFSIGHRFSQLDTSKSSVRPFEMTNHPSHLIAGILFGYTFPPHIFLEKNNSLSSTLYTIC